MRQMKIKGSIVWRSKSTVLSLNVQKKKVKLKHQEAQTNTASDLAS